MKVLLVAIFLVLTLKNVQSERTFYFGHRIGGNVPPPEGLDLRAGEVTTSYISQRIDHFTPTDTRTFQQKYFVNDEYYNSTEGKHAFLMIGGESAASAAWMTNGAWIDSAEQYGAMLFYLEHRYYGDSQPFSDWSTENLRYLTSQQAIEDLATFISAMNEQYDLPDDVKWIAFGGSYAGSLAAWLRQKYPHLVTGAMSASGPLLALLDYYEYLQVVVDDLATHSQQCVDSLQTAVNQLDELLTNETYDQLNSLFNPCETIESSDGITSQDISYLFEAIADNFAGVAQYNKNARLSGAVRNVTVDTLCDILTNDSYGTELERLAEVNTLVNSDCLDFKYDTLVATWGNTTIDPSNMMRQWVYQTCTEYGFYQTSSQEIQVFGDKFPLVFFTQLCVDVYGSGFNETLIQAGINFTNLYYGEKNIHVSNVVFVHGSFDPWYPLGITETISDRAPAIFINGTAHCANMYPPSDSDLEELTAAREEVNRLIGEWLAGSDSSESSAAKAGPVFFVGVVVLSVLYQVLGL